MITSGTVAVMTDEPLSRFFSAQRLRLHYVDWGNEDAPPLILIHGGRDHCRSWDRLAMRFRASHHVVAFDLRGHGDSDWADGNAYPAWDILYDIARFIAVLKAERPVLVGHSLGALSALNYAGTFPQAVGAVVALDGIVPEIEVLEGRALPAAVRYAGWVASAAAAEARPSRGYDSVEDAARRLQVLYRGMDPAQTLDIARHGLRLSPQGRWIWKWDPNSRASAPYGLTLAELADLWPRIACPVLSIHGANSRYGRPGTDPRADLLKSAQFHTLDGAGHWVHHDRLATVVELMTEFLQQSK